MTDPLALEPILGPRERTRPASNEELPHDERHALFEAHVTGGGKVEATDWMPDEYRTAVLRFVEMHANSELMGVLPEREWLMRAPTLRRKLALTAKVQDEVGHAQLLYRVAEDLGKTREAMFDDLLAGRTKFHNVFHYPTVGWADVGMIAWLVDAAAIVAQQALRDSSYAPYARTMRKICWEESVHIMHGRDIVVTMATGSPTQRAAIQDALDRWWGPLMQMHGPRSPRETDRDLHWRIKAKTSEELRQEFLTIYVPRIRELGLVIPDDALAWDDEAATWRYAEPDWAELRTVVTNHGPMSEQRLAFRRDAREATRWVREAIFGDPGRMSEGPASGTVGGLPPGARRRPDASRRQRHGARRGPRCALRSRAVRPSTGERPAVGGPPSGCGRHRRPGPAPATARSLVQEARWLRHARQARRGPRGRRSAEAQGSIGMSVAAPPTTGLADLLLAMADDEFVIGFSDSEWTGIAPILEEDVAMSSLAQDELGHASALYGLLAPLTGNEADAIAYDR